MSPEEKEQVVSTEVVGAEQEVAGATEDETEKKDDSATSDEEKREGAREVTGDEEEAQQQVKEKPKKLSGFDRKIRRAEAQRDAAQAERDYLHEQLALARQPKETETTTIEAKSKPKQQDFALKEEDGGGYDLAAFTEALTDWKVEQSLAKRDAKTRESQIQTEQQRIGQVFLEREIAFSETLPENLEEGEDYDKVANAAIGMMGQLNTPATREISAAITNFEQGPAVLYFLGQNPDELQRIAKQNPKTAVMSLGAIAAKLAENTQETDQETLTPVVSRAPKPLTPVKKPASGKKARADDPDTHHQLTDEEFAAARSKQRLSA